MISSVASLATPEEKPASPELKSRLVSSCNFLLKQLKTHSIQNICGKRKSTVKWEDFETLKLSS